MKVMLAGTAAMLLCLARADSSADFVECDLLARMYDAFDNLHHAEGKDEIDRGRVAILGRFEKALGFDQSTPGRTINAQLYLPAQDGDAAPAIIIVRPHEDPKSEANQKFAASLAQAGFVVLIPDLRADHDKVDLAATGGLTPESLLQRDVRAMLDFLSRRGDVDPPPNRSDRNWLFSRFSSRAQYQHLRCRH
jgi:hypothetical protein